MKTPADSPWLNAVDSGKYIGRSRRFIAREVKAGRLRAARIGDRQEILCRREWLDQYVSDREHPVEMALRRRA
jgi:hypothetical protein